MVGEQKPTFCWLFLQTMLSEEIHTTPDWTSLSGRVLEGGYEVQELLEAEHDRAKYKIRVLGGGGVEAFADFVRAEGAAAEDQVQLWEAARELQHPNLNTPLTTGQTQQDGVDLIYVVLRKPDEILSSALLERPLACDEAGEVLASISRALEHLHQQDLVHGCVSPEQILATGDSIQLSTEWVRRAGNAPGVELAAAKYIAPESAGVNVTAAADMWCLGATLFEILKQKEFGADSEEQVGSLPAPFGGIVERCLDTNPQTRCGLSEALNLYQGHSDSPVQESRPPVREPELTRVTKVMPVREKWESSPASRMLSRAARVPLTTWMYVALVLIAAVLIVWAAKPKHSRQVNTSGASKPSDAAASNNTSWQTRTLGPDANAAPGKSHQRTPNQAGVSPETRAAAGKPDVRVIKPQPHTVNGPVWRVIAFTYSSAEAAQSRVRVIGEKHPELKPEAFSPEGRGGLYLVTLGGRMDREEAARLRQKALRLGMPHDTYIQNYSR
jgi:eukaryotic-like serine/threonine-protein kinase